MFLISFASAWEYQSSYSYGSAHAFAEVIGEYPTCSGHSSGSYCVGDYVANVGYKGDKFYIGYSYTSYSSIGASQSGVSGIPRGSSGKKVLPLKNGHPKCYLLYAWDYNRASNGDWSWASKGGGYLCDVFPELTIVKCLDNSDCASNYICDRSGSWENWNCKLKICNEAEERCFGPNLQKCEGNKWVDKGTVLNKCNVECLRDSNCPIINESEKFCSGNDIMKTKTNNSCLNYKCENSTQDVLLGTCTFKCEKIEGDGAICIKKICDEGKFMCSDEGNALMCQDNKWELKDECKYGCEEGICKSFYTTTLFYILFGSSILLIFLIVKSVIFLKKKRRK